MDIFELKAEASKLGYKLIPIKKMPKKLPCVCGCNRRTKWWTAEGLFYECNNCHKESPVGKTEFDAVNKWNEMIEWTKVIEAEGNDG